MRRLVVWSIVLLLIVSVAGVTALALLEGDGAGRAETPVHTPSPSGPPPAMPPTPRGLAAYYDQSLDWQPCDGDESHDCATMQVPLDYADPAGQTIELALLRVRAAAPDARVGSLVVNPGGPGGSGTSYAAAGKTVWGPALLNHFDLVGLDPRGVGDSAAIDCLSDDGLDAYLAADPDPETAADEAVLQRQLGELGSGCVAKSGALASHVTTVEAARDLDVLRAVLDQPRLDFFGASYGTKLGATYAQLFPRRVGRMVLDGAVDLSISRRELTLQQAVGFETALRAYVANCVDPGNCFLGATVDDGMARIQQFLADTEQSPLPTGGERMLTGGSAYYGLITPLYERRYWNLLSLSLRQAFDGDGTSMLLLADAYASRGPDGYLSNTIEANYAITCLDDPASVPVSQVPAEVPAFERASPTFGAVFAYSLAGCSGSVARSTVKVPHDDAAGAAPLLVVGTTRDPATPLRWARALADQLSSAVLVTRDGDGHTGYHSGNDCVDSVIEDYLVDGTVPSDDVDCPAP
ncbi:Tripeptidyl-peptidase B, Serine peptidase, MEROPS family S33 [metagenome]|uniref:Tripeptidyl-peptidase B, Serine peptidase, MEROPS family S33 n=1 Tax=metagenome TaxID=256318 RepID=A0A2P2CF50_9ZZZZ